MKDNVSRTSRRSGDANDEIAQRGELIFHRADAVAHDARASRGFGKGVERERFPGSLTERTVLVALFLCHGVRAALSGGDCHFGEGAGVGGARRVDFSFQTFSNEIRWVRRELLALVARDHEWDLARLKRFVAQDVEQELGDFLAFAREGHAVHDEDDGARPRQLSQRFLAQLGVSWNVHDAHVRLCHLSPSAILPDDDRVAALVRLDARRRPETLLSVLQPLPQRRLPATFTAEQQHRGFIRLRTRARTAREGGEGATDAENDAESDDDGQERDDRDERVRGVGVVDGQTVREDISRKRV